MNGEHFGEHLVNILVNTFLREVNIMNTSRVFNSIIIKNTKLRKYTCMYVRKVFIMFTDRSKIFTKVFTKYSLNYSLSFFILGGKFTTLVTRRLF